MLKKIVIIINSIKKQIEIANTNKVIKNFLFIIMANWITKE